MHRRRVRRVLWAVVVCVLVILAVFFNRPAKPPPAQVFRTRAGVMLPGYSSNGTIEEPSKSDIAQVVRLLNTRAHAVLAGDEAAFMSVVDRDRAAFSHRQRVVWANTRQLPLASLSFAYDGVVEPDTPLHRATFLARVTTTYQLAGYDTSPVQVDDGYSFVKQQGRWKLAGVTDADGQFDLKALPVPWDGDAIDTYGDGDYLAVVDRGREALARRIVVVCHEGSRAIHELLGVVNTRPTVVLATSHASGFASDAGLDAQAVTYPLAGPDGVTPGWRVMVNPQDVDQVAASPVVLPHELTHLETQDYLAYLPAWLAEGSAEYVGWHSQGGLPVAMPARGYRWRHALPNQLPISSRFYHDDIQLDYLEGMALVTWIEEHRGRSAVLSLMRAYADAGGWDLSYDPDTETPRILHQVLEMSPGSLAKAAYAEMNATLPRS